MALYAGIMFSNLGIWGFSVGVTIGSGVGVISVPLFVTLIVISTYTPDFSTVIALIVVVPAETPVTTPSVFTVAILVSSDDHSIPLFVAFSGLTVRFIIFFSPAVIFI